MTKRMVAVAVVLGLTLGLWGCKDKTAEKPLTDEDYRARQLMSYNADIKTLTDMLAQDPGNAGAHIKLGNIYMDTQRFQDAIDSYGRALELDPNNTNVRVDRGTCYRSIGMPDAALAEYDKALAIDPNHPNGHMNKAVVLFYDLGKAAEALPEFEAYLRIEPNSPNAAGIRQEVERIKAMLADPGKQTSEAPAAK